MVGRSARTRPRARRTARRARRTPRPPRPSRAGGVPRQAADQLHVGRGRRPGASRGRRGRGAPRHWTVQGRSRGSRAGAGRRAGVGEVDAAGGDLARRSATSASARARREVDRGQLGRAPRRRSPRPRARRAARGRCRVAARGLRPPAAHDPPLDRGRARGLDQLLGDRPGERLPRPGRRRGAARAGAGSPGRAAGRAEARVERRAGRRRRRARSASARSRPRAPRRPRAVAGARRRRAARTSPSGRCQAWTTTRIGRRRAAAAR